MDLQHTLTKIGLSENQAKVYIATLQLGDDTVLNITKTADLKRSTVYLILEDLETKGLVRKITKNTKTLYTAEDPEKLLEDLKIKTQFVKNALPALKAIHNIDPEKPHITVDEGVGGVRKTYRDIFNHLIQNPHEELLIFGSLKDASTNFRSSVLDYFFDIIGQSKNAIREIGNDDHETRMYYRTSSKLNPKHDIRLIRNEGVFVQTDNMIYGNTLVIFSVKEQIFATRIESKNIVDTYRTLFEMAWRSGKIV